MVDLEVEREELADKLDTANKRITALEKKEKEKVSAGCAQSTGARLLFVCPDFQAFHPCVRFITASRQLLASSALKVHL